MGEIKELNIKIQTYCFFNDITDIKNFHSNLLKIDKKHYKDNDIYYIGYITIRKFGEYENIHSVNLLYLIFHSAAGYFGEKFGEKYFILDSTEKYKKFFLGLNQKLKQLMVEKSYIIKNNYARIRVDTDDNVPLNKKLKFPTLTIIIKRVFQDGKKLYPQIYLDECFYEL